MSAILGTAVTGAGGGAYTIDNSLRFRASASAYLNRSLAGSGSLTTWTWSAWVKLGRLGISRGLFGAADLATGSSNGTNGLQIRDNDTIQYYLNNFSGVQVFNIQTTQVFRDPSAWYHIVLTYDSTNGTSSDRIRLYINGSRVTAFSSTTYPGSSQSTYINQTGYTQFIAKDWTNSYYDGYMAEVNFINGQALTPSSFGATDANTGVWQPKAYAGSYGTNGFYLKFSDIATTSGSNAGLGKDFSGNANYWNTNNISVTAGVTYDAMTDSPTPKSSTVGNYCVLNPVSKTSSTTVLNANLGVTTSNINQAVGGTFAVNTGKWYWEATVGTSVSGEAFFGIATTAFDETRYAGGAYVLYVSDGTAYTTSTFGYGASYAQGDVLACALNCDTGTVTFYKNGVSQGNITGVSMTTPWKASLQLAGFSVSTAWNFNFGQRPFTYTPPTGFNRLQTYNLPTPTIGATAATTAGKYFNPVLYTGNGTADGVQQAITGIGFAPDMVWLKSRSSATAHYIADQVRGVNKTINTNNTNAEQTQTIFPAFGSDGFTVERQASNAGVNENGATYVAWNWNAGGSTVTNTSGSISAQVRANTTAGFSIITYTGNATSGATVGHGLGVAPSFIICKTRTQASVDWPTYHISTGNNGGCTLNETAAKATTAIWWNNTTPSSTVVTLGSGAQTNGNTQSMVMYCFAQIAGYSAFGSYTGNGSTDGPFIYLGFRPEFVMIKNASAVTDWKIMDAARNLYNPETSTLAPNTSGSEDTNSSYAIDYLSNGFKIRNTFSTWNGSGNTLIYMAFAESPFKYANAR